MHDVLVRPGRRHYNEIVMAIYHLNAKVITRSKGQSLVGSVAYGCRSRMRDERTGVVHQYSQKENEKVESFVSLPEGCKEEWRDPEYLANEIELFEDRLADKRFRIDQSDPLKAEKSLIAKEAFINSAQTAQSLIIALRNGEEINSKQQLESVRHFVDEVFVSRGLPVITSVHLEEGNPHAHIKVGRRAIISGEFSESKDRWIVSKDGLNHIRSEWARCDNEVARAYGDFERIDHRSYADRQISLLPSSHEGWYGRYLKNKGRKSRIIEENAEVKAFNADAIKRDPSLLVDSLVNETSVFTKEQLAVRLAYKFMNDEKLMQMHCSLMGFVDGQSFDESDAKAAGHYWARKYLEGDKFEVVGHSPRGELLYCSKLSIEQEKEIKEYLTVLSEGRSYGRIFNRAIGKGNIDKAINRFNKTSAFELTNEQKQTIHALCGKGSSLRILQGAAGTGKTKVLSLVADLYRNNGYNVIGASFQASAVQTLRSDIGGDCRTLDNIKYNLEAGRISFGKKDILIIDEANMVSARLFKPVFDAAMKNGSQVILVGDQKQILARGKLDVFRHASAVAPVSKLSQIVRQRESWMREASIALSNHNIEKGFGAYRDKGCIKFHDSSAEVYHSAASDVMHHVSRMNDFKEVLVTSYRNQTVFKLNQAIRKKLVQNNILSGKVGFEHMGKAFIEGERILFTKNDNTGQKVATLAGDASIKGVRNGDLGFIESFDLEKNQAIAQLDNGRRICFNPFDYKDFDYGYAMSVNKSEGRTVDKHILVMDKLMDANKSYVAATRHREYLSIHVDKHDASNFAELVSQIGFGEFKLSSLDVKGGLGPNAKKVLEGYIKAHEDLRELYGIDRSSKPYEAIRHLETEKQAHAKVIAKHWEIFEPHCLALRMRRDWIEVDAGMRERLVELNSEDQKRSDLIRDYSQSKGKKEKFLKAYALASMMNETKSSKIKPHGEIYRQLSENGITVQDLEVASRLYRVFQGGGIADKAKLFDEYRSYRAATRDLADQCYRQHFAYKVGLKTAISDYLKSVNEETGQDLHLEDFRELKQLSAQTLSVQSLEVKDLKTIGREIESHYGEFDFGSVSKKFYDALLSEEKIHYDAGMLANSRNAGLYAHKMLAGLEKDKAEAIFGDHFSKISSSARRHLFDCMSEHFDRAEKLDDKIDTACSLNKMIEDEPRRFNQVLKEEKPYKREAIKLYSHIRNYEGDKAQASKDIDHYIANKQSFKEHLESLKPEKSIALMRAELKVQNVRQELKGHISKYADKYKATFGAEIKDAAYEGFNHYMALKRSSDKKLSEDKIVSDARKIFDSNLKNPMARDSGFYIFNQLKTSFKAVHEAEQSYNALARSAQKEVFNVALYRARAKSAEHLLESSFGQHLFQEASKDFKIIQGSTFEKEAFKASHQVEASKAQAAESKTKDSDKFYERSFVDVDAVKDKIAAHADEIARQLLGAPNPKLSNQQTLRFGSKGSLAVTIKGAKAGMWHDFERGESGHLFNLAKEELSLNFKETLSHFSDYFGGSDLKQIERVPVNKEKEGLKEQAQAQQKQQVIDKIIRETKGLNGTAAELYLKGRGINPEHLSDDLRYHPGIYDKGTKRNHSALIAIARNHAGKAKAIQMIALTPEGKKANVDIVKKSYGQLKGVFVEIQKADSHSKDKVTYVAEGPETAASIANAKPGARVLAALGLFNFKQLDHMKGQEVKLCADHDDPKQKAHAVKQLHQAEEHLKAAGVKVEVIKPHQVGKDFNDVLKHDGLKELQNQLNNNILQTQKEIEISR